MSLSTVRLSPPALEVWLPGALVNPLNGSLSRAHWTVKRKWATTWKEKTRAVVLAGLFGRGVVVDQHRPKRITFTLFTPRGFDDDAFGPVTKPIRDALIGYVIQDDGPQSGHEFRYEQVITKRRRGVRITIEMLRPTTTEAAACLDS